MKLLLCEDEIELANALCAILKYNKFSVDVVFDGEEALDYIENSTYDAIILDIMMPKVNGIEVLKKVRANGNSTPILLLTAKSQVEDKVLGLDSGANDYLTKPFATPELLARIRVLTRGIGEKNTSLLSFGNLTLNRATYELSSPIESVELANKEFQMLELLMSNPRNLISTERFLEKIWGFDSEAELSIVWVYISYLRKKLVQLNADVRIKVTRNTGYSLEMIE